MHISSTDKKTWHIWNNIFCSRIHRSGRPWTIFYLTASHSFLSFSLPLATSPPHSPPPPLLLPTVTTLDYFFHTLSTPAPPCLLSHPFFFLLCSSSLPYFSQALLISAEPSLDGEQPFYIITWSRGHPPPHHIPPPPLSHTIHNDKQINKKSACIIMKIVIVSSISLSKDWISFCIINVTH